MTTTEAAANLIPAEDSQLKAALAALTTVLTDLGISTPSATDATNPAAGAGTSTTSALLTGIFSGLRGLSSALFMLFIGSVIFLFITAYVPFIGATIAGVLVCIIALGPQGLTAALILLVVPLFVNSVLQNLLAPVAYGSSLNLDPLVVLLVTTAAGLVGGVGLIVLAAPLTAVISRTARRLAAARQQPVEPVHGG